MSAPSFPPTPKFTSAIAETKKSRRRNAWAAEVARRVEARAAEMFPDDEAMRVIAVLDMWFRAETLSLSEPRVRDDGGRWWLVGRNASHDFYLGFLPGGEFGRASCGEGLVVEGDEEFDIAEWRSLRNYGNYCARRGGDGCWQRAELTVRDGRLVRVYDGCRWSQSPARLDDLGYLGHC